MFKSKSFGLSGKLKLLFSCLLVLAMLVPAAVTPVLVDAAGTQYYRSITINAGQVPSTQTNFPVLVSLSGNYLKTAAPDGHVANASGSDIYFTDSTGATRYYFEIEKYDNVNGALAAWVKVPSLSTGTELRMYYGGDGSGGTYNNSHNVWDSNFKGVWHLGQVAATDSSSSGNNGTKEGTGTLSVVNGQVGDSLNFPGSGAGTPAVGGPPAYLDCGNDSSLHFSASGSYTWSTWVNPTAGQDGGSGVFEKKTPGADATGQGYVVNLGGNTPSVRFQSTSSNVSGRQIASSGEATFGTWTYITITYVNGATSIYLNGELDISGSITTTADTINDFLIGRRSADSTKGYFYGQIDEARFSTTSRSADWTKTEYNNQKTPGDFYAVGPESTINNTPTLSSIAVAPSGPPDLGIGSTQAFTATGTYSDTSTANITSQVTWDSSVDSIATISTTGIATGVTAGTTNITASLDGITSTAVQLKVVAGVTLAVSQVTVEYLDQAALSATLTKNGTPLSGKTVAFTLNGISAGSATTNASGVASNSVTLPSSINPGTYTYGTNSGVGAAFAGDASNTSASGGNTLTVNKGTTDITVDAATGSYGGTVTLKATLTCHGVPINVSKGPTLTLNGTVVGSQIATDSNGVATLSDVSLNGINPGTYNYGTNSGIGASFGATTKYTAGSGGNTLTVTAPQGEYTLTVNVTPAGSGTVDKDLAAPYHWGDVVTLTPHANSGYTFVGFSANVVDNKVTITDNTTVTATFSPDVTVSVQAPAHVTPGADFTASVDITTINFFNVADYTVTFDPAVISLKDVTTGSIGATEIPLAFNETTPGNVKIVNNMNLPASGVSGSGSLAVLHFTAVGSGGQSSLISLSGGTIASNAAVRIPASWIGDTVHLGSEVQITLSNLAQTYDGTPKYATATPDIPGVAITVTYSQNGSPVTSPIDTGSYDVLAVPTDSSYAGSASGVLVINQATPEITWSDPAGIVYGTALGNTQLNATANTPGDFVYSPDAGTVLNAGNSQTLNVTFTPNDTLNYKTAAASVHINVARADQTITFAPISDKGYASPDFTIEATASSGLTVTFTAAGSCEITGSTVHITGTGSCTITAHQAGNGNYNAAPDVSQSFEVTSLAGDANGDGAINALDITKLTRIILELDAPTATADANGDGEINALDIAQVEIIILNAH